MPLILFFLFVFFLFQPELIFIGGFYWFDFSLIFLDNFFSYFTLFGLFNDGFTLTQDFTAFKLNAKLNYNYNFRTYFTQTYLHHAFNEYMKPYKNFTRFDKMFGDYNLRTSRKKKHGRATHAKDLFTLLYSYTFDYYGLINHNFNKPFVLLYFKKQHLYSVVEMTYAVIYLGMVYLLSYAHVRNIEESALPIRETEEIDEEYSQSQWYFYRENRRGMTPPQIEDNIEIDFAYPQHPIEWDDLGNVYRWESHFFNAMYSYLVGWGVSQSAVTMFFYDYSIDLHYVDIFSTIIFLFVFWRLFFYPQFIFYFNRFRIRKVFYLDVLLNLFYNFSIKVLSFFYNYIWIFVISIFSNNLRLDTLKVSSYQDFVRFLMHLSAKYDNMNNLLRFYRYIYSFFQKDLNLFERRNRYEIIITSNLYFLENSKDRLDDLYYFQGNKDSTFCNLTFFADFFIRNYRFIRFFYVPQNLYLTDNRVYLPQVPLFPLYSDSYNLDILPIWGGDLLFNLNQNALSFAEVCSSWFFNNQYNKKFKSSKKRYENVMSMINKALSIYS